MLTVKKNKNVQLYLELGPIHAHVDSVVEGPPLEILVVVRIVDCVVQFFVDLRQTAMTTHATKKKKKRKKDKYVTFTRSHSQGGRTHMGSWLMFTPLWMLNKTSLKKTSRCVSICWHFSNTSFISSMYFGL